MAAAAAVGFSQTPYWSYDFTGGSLQDGVGNDDLTQTGSALTTVADRFSSAGDAVNLNSDVLQGGIVFPTAPGQMGYSFWIKDAVDDANIRIIIDQFDDYGNSIRLQNGKIVVIGRPGYFINPNWNPAFSQTQTLTSTTDVDDGNWHHVVVNAARRSQQEITDYELYIDGVLEDSDFANVSLITNQGTAFRPYPTGAPFRIAPDNVNGALQYENIIDDIRYFDQKLSQAQVTALFNAQPPAVCYVDKDATGANDGSSWADAYTSLQSAMSAASGTGDEIWVAEGTYKPDASNRAVFFTLKPGVSLYGGFNGTETSLAQRDWNTYETILSGDLNDNDDNSNVAGLYSEPTRSDNSHRILFLDGNGSTIDGVTIEGGQANLSSNPAFDRGSAIFVDGDVSSIVVRNTTFRYNASRIGNFYISYGAQNPANSAVIESCDFEGNFSRYGAGLSLIVNATGASADVGVYNSRFYNNHAGPAAGQTGFAGSSMALFANQGTVNAELVNNTFAYNIDNTTASGIDAATVVMRRLDNSSTDITNLEMYNNIFFNNEDGNGNVNPSGIGGWNFFVFSSITADNNLHDQGELVNRTSNFIGSANLTAAPNFVDGPNGDLRLTASSWVIDQGDNSKLPASITKDVDGEDRILNSTIDLGAHEYNANLCNPPVAINTQPTDESVCASDNVTLDVAAAGNNVTYQWQLDGVDISGATSSSLTINGVGQNDLGDYTVIVSDACNDVTSSIASVGLNAATAISTQPTDETVCAGGNASFSVSANGSNLSYQWKLDGTNLSGETSPTLNVNGVSVGNAGNYTVEVSGDCGTETSAVAALTVNETTAITSQPADITACQGTSGTVFSVTASGSNLTYQWFKEGTALTGETAASLNLGQAAPSEAGDYTVEVTGDCGTETSAVATLTVNALTAITSQPSDETLCAGDDVTFSVAATGSNLSYQWKLDGSNLSGETSVTLDLIGVAAGDAGNYTVEVSGDCGTETSNVAALTVNQSTAITSQPSDETLCAGDNASFSVSANGSNLSYQWKLDGTNLSGETSATLDLTGVAAGDAGNYTVEVSGDCGTVTSDAAALTVNEETVIAAQPNGVNLCEGSPVTIEVQADGSNLTYQWSKDGNVLAGETQSTLSIASLSAAEVGNYTVAVTGDCGTVTSNVADVLMIIAPAITAQPIDVTACEGESVTFSADYDGQWFDINWSLDGSVIASAGDPNVTLGPNTPGGSGTFELELTGVELADAGDYTLEITGYCIGHNQVSDAATLTVNELPEPVITENMGMLETGVYDSYQWSINGNIQSGETNSSIAVTIPGDYTVEVTLNGCIGESDPYTPMTVGISEAENDITRVYPNPFADMVNIELAGFDGQVEVTVLDVAGRVVYRANEGGTLVQLDLAQLGSGTYSLVVRGENGETVVRRMIKN